VHGRGNRRDGRQAICATGQVSAAKAMLRDKCKAVRFEITGELQRPPVEVARLPDPIDLSWTIGSLPGLPSRSLIPQLAEEPDAEHLPDG
jgi:hypothetical protein